MGMINTSALGNVTVTFTKAEWFVFQQLAQKRLPQKEIDDAPKHEWFNYEEFEKRYPTISREASNG